MTIVVRQPFAVYIFPTEGEKLAGKTKGKLKLDTLKGAGHGNCLECHKEQAKDPAKKALKSCKTCHPK